MKIPDGVVVNSNARVVTVKGPKGTLTRDFKHMSIDLTVSEDGKSIKVDMWFSQRKTLAALRTICSHIENMITGVTRAFKYKMRFVYSHFPINVSLVENNVEIRNFLGERRVRKVELCDGVDYVRTSDVKDQIELSGMDVNKVSLSAARIRQACLVRKKDIRKFLDGIFVSEKGHVENLE